MKNLLRHAASKRFVAVSPARFTRFAKSIAVALLCAACLAGCSVKPLKPWVKPYERQNLADPIMSFDANPVQGSYMHHVFQGRESARGAEGGSGGGCGCS